MSVSITHAKVSGKAAGNDPDRVYGTHWDADHVVPVATVAEAQAATSDTVLMTPAKTLDLVNANVPSGSALTKVDDTNVTLTLGGTPTTALLRATSITVGWTGTLAAARLNSNVVQAITNDTNVTGSIAAQNLTLSWTGTLAAGRLNANVVQGVTNDTNVTGSIATQNLTLGWTGTLSVARGGTGAGSASGTALDNITGFSSTGILARTASGTYAFRTIIGTAGQITVTNGDGVPGNPTISLPATITQATTFSGILTVSNATASTAYTNGALVLSSGGLGVNGAGYFNGAVVAPTAVFGDTSTLISAPPLYVTNNIASQIVTVNTGSLASTGGSGIALYHGAIPDAADRRLGFFLGGAIGSGTARNAALVGFFSNEVWTAGSAQGSYVTFETTTNGAASRTVRLKVYQGLDVGSATGGDKGAGTANFAGDIYKNNTAYTNPDYAFEHFYTGKIELFANNEGADSYRGLMPLDDLRDYTRRNLRLPGINDEGMGIFARSDLILEKFEEMTLYTLDLHERVKKLEAAH